MATNSPIDHRQTWLSPPGPTVGLDTKLAANARRSLTALRKATQEADPVRAQRSRLAEADASSLIEQVNADPTDPAGFTGALAEAIRGADGTTEPEEILRWHGRLLRDHPRPDLMTPGQYRRLGVTVGGWLPPHHADVPDHMERFHRWLSQENDPLMRAVWGHRYFETIHPFADGNGRTGRMLIAATLGIPICISRAIWWERTTYMELLAYADWHEWSRWMLEKIREEGYRTARDLRQGPTHDTDQRVARWLIQKPLPQRYNFNSTAEMMEIERQLRNRIQLEEAPKPP